MKSRPRLIILSAALLVTLLCVGAAVASPGQARKSPVPVQQQTDEPAPPKEEPDDGSKYTVRAFEGRVAVYLSGREDAPQYVTDVYVSTLPAADREALARGIPIFTEEELSSILEDYGS